MCARRPGITRRSAARTYHHIAPVANVGRGGRCGGKERRTRMCTRDLWYYQVKYTRRTLAGKMVSKKSRNLLRSSSSSSSSHDIVPLVFPPMIPLVLFASISKRRDHAILVFVERKWDHPIFDFEFLFKEIRWKTLSSSSATSCRRSWRMGGVSYRYVIIITLVDKEKDNGERGAASNTRRRHVASEINGWLAFLLESLPCLRSIPRT